MIVDGLFCGSTASMGAHGDKVAGRSSASTARSKMSGVRSHQRAIAAIDDGRMADEIVPGRRRRSQGDDQSRYDEAPRRIPAPEALAKLEPAFSGAGTVTAGNAAGVNDGAAALVIASERVGDEQPQVIPRRC